MKGPSPSGLARSSPRWTRLLPSTPTHFDGPAYAWWFAAAYLTIVTARSLIHVLAPDGGAGSIATVDIAVAGGPNIVAMFGQWGAIQLLLALLLWVLLLRYRGLVPLILLVFLVEPALRELSGWLKPIETLGTAPGAALNWAAVPVLAVVWWLSLRPGREPVSTNSRRNRRA